MKAADRCKEHYQGDRCRKPTGHDYRQVEPDPVHEGVHNSWELEPNPVEGEGVKWEV